MPAQLGEHDGFEIFVRLAVQLEEHVLFRSEVVVERADRHAGVLHYLMDGQATIETILIDQLDGGVEYMLLGCLCLQCPGVYLFRLDHIAHSSWNREATV